MALSDYGAIKYWLDLNQEAFTQGQVVSSLTDQTGGGNNWTGSGSNMLMQRNAFNGRHAVSINGDGSHWTRNEANIFPAAHTQLWACKFLSTNSPVTQRFLIDSPNDGAVSRHSISWLSTNGTINMGIDGGGGNIAFPAPVAHEIAVYAFTYNGAASEVRRNVHQVVTGTLTTTTGSQPQGRIGARLDGSSSMAGLWVAEIVCYSLPLSVVNIAAASYELMANHRIPRPRVVIG
jgi:hypothetical protein